MSGKARERSGSGEADRRVRRTRRALLDAFSSLVLSRRYDEIRVADIAGEADVGRSTLYEHFAGKDELLLRSLSGILDVLAGAVREDSGTGALEHILEHLRENRTLARYLFSGPPGEVLAPRFARELSARIEDHLRLECRRRRLAPSLPLPLIAADLAGAELSLVRSWLAGHDSCGAKVLAEGLRAGTRGAAEALLKKRP